MPAGLQGLYMMLLSSEINWLGSTALVALGAPRPTEEFDECRVLEVMEAIIASGAWTRKVALERDYLTIMDGHHRFEVARRLGLNRLPCALFCYDEVEVYSRREGITFTIEEIISRGLAGRLFPHKTTRHVFRKEDDLVCAVPLALLR